MVSSSLIFSLCNLDICNFCDTDFQYLKYLLYLQRHFFQSDSYNTIFKMICNICDSDKNSVIFAIACISRHKCSKESSGEFSNMSYGVFGAQTFKTEETKGKN